jgi:hypothetical protein
MKSKVRMFKFVIFHVDGSDQWVKQKTPCLRLTWLDEVKSWQIEAVYFSLN